MVNPPPSPPHVRHIGSEQCLDFRVEEREVHPVDVCGCGVSGQNQKWVTESECLAPRPTLHSRAPPGTSSGCVAYSVLMAVFFMPNLSKNFTWAREADGLGEKMAVVNPPRPASSPPSLPPASTGCRFPTPLALILL